MKRYIKTCNLAAVTASALVFTTSLSNAAVTITSDDFEVALPTDGSVNNARGISLDPNGSTQTNNLYSAAEATVVNDGIAWRDVSGIFDATGAVAFNSNARVDQAGNGSATGMRVRAGTGAATLDSAMQLVALSATSVTMTYDVNLDDNSAYTLLIQYSDSADFSSAITLATLTSDGTNNGGFMTGESVTVTDGVGGVTFTDDAYFMIIRDGAGANSSFHTFDNIVITAETIPEPSSGALLGLGGLALILRRRK